MESSWTRDQTCVPCIGRLILLHCATRKVPCCCYCSVTLVMSNSLQPHRHSLPGSSVHGDSPGKNTGVSCHALLQGIFPTQESFPSPGDLTNPRIEPESLVSPALAGGFFTTSATWEALLLFHIQHFLYNKTAFKSTIKRYIFNEI